VAGGPVQFDILNIEGKDLRRGLGVAPFVLGESGARWRKKQVPPLRRRIRSGSGRNDKELLLCYPKSGSVGGNLLVGNLVNR